MLIRIDSGAEVGFFFGDSLADETYFVVLHAFLRIASGDGARALLRMDEVLAVALCELS